MKLIDKEKVVAEIKKLRKRAYELYGCSQFDTAYNNVLDSIDTLEVKGVDINKEISQFIDANFEKATIGHKISLRRVAKHFFELGLKAQKGE